MNRKEIMEGLLDFHDISLPVEFFSDYAIELDPETGKPIKVYVQDPETPIEGVNARIVFAQAKWTKEYLADNDLQMSYHAFAMLHELGHLKSEQGDPDDYHTDLETLEKLFYENLIDEENYINLYNLIEDEQNANEWAINYIKSDIMTANWLNSLMN